MEPVVMFPKNVFEPRLYQMQHYVRSISPSNTYIQMCSVDVEDRGCCDDVLVVSASPDLCLLVVHAVGPGLVPELDGHVHHGVPLHAPRVHRET